MPSPELLESHKITVVHFAVTLFANLFPLFIGLLLTFARQKWEGLEPFYSGGEFYIYSAALLGPSCYVFYSYKRKIYDRLSILFLFSLLVAITASSLYAFLIVDGSQFSRDVLMPTSYVVLGYTILVYYYANLTDEVRRVNVQARQRGDINDLKNQLGD